MDDGVEDLRVQTLGDSGGDVTIDDVIRRVQTSSVLPKSLTFPTSPASSTTTATESNPDMAVAAQSVSILQDINNAILEGNRAILQEIERNSRVVRCLEKSISEQTVTIKSIKEVFETFVNYTRQYNREERGQMERREEERKRERQECIRRTEARGECRPGGKNQQ